MGRTGGVVRCIFVPAAVVSLVDMWHCPCSLVVRMRLAGFLQGLSIGCGPRDVFVRVRLLIIEVKACRCIMNRVRSGGPPRGNRYLWNQLESVLEIGNLLTFSE